MASFVRQRGLFAAAFALVAPAAAAQPELNPPGSPPAPPPAPLQASVQVQDVALPETISLARLVDVAAEVSGQGYSYQPAELDVAVTLRVPGGLARADVPALLAHVLAARG